MIDFEEMVILLMGYGDKNMQMGLDYEEDSEIWLELDEELEDSYLDNNLSGVGYCHKTSLPSSKTHL